MPYPSELAPKFFLSMILENCQFESGSSIWGYQISVLFAARLANVQELSLNNRLDQLLITDRLGQIIVLLSPLGPLVIPLLDMPPSVGVLG